MACEIYSQMNSWATFSLFQTIFHLIRWVALATVTLLVQTFVLYSITSLIKFSIIRHFALFYIMLNSSVFLNWMRFRIKCFGWARVHRTSTKMCVNMDRLRRTMCVICVSAICMCFIFFRCVTRCEHEYAFPRIAFFQVAQLIAMQMQLMNNEKLNYMRWRIRNKMIVKFCFNYTLCQW